MGSDDVVLLTSASQDLDDGEAFYDGRQAGLGAYFLSCLLSDLESLKIYAGVHPTTKNQLHYMRAKRFPCMIYYRVISGVCYVVAILPTKRNPRWVKHSLSER